MADYNLLLNIVKRAATEATEASNPVNICFGTVISVAPLKILVDQKMILGTAQLVLTRNVTDFDAEISFNDQNIKQKFTTWDVGETIESSPSKIAFKEKIKHKITVYNGLKVGDKVILLREQGGQKYIVLDRIGGK